MADFITDNGWDEIYSDSGVNDKTRAQLGVTVDLFMLNPEGKDTFPLLKANVGTEDRAKIRAVFLNFLLDVAGEQDEYSFTDEDDVLFRRAFETPEWGVSPKEMCDQLWEVMQTDPSVNPTNIDNYGRVVKALRQHPVKLHVNLPITTQYEVSLAFAQALRPILESAADRGVITCAKSYSGLFSGDFDSDLLSRATTRQKHVNYSPLSRPL